MTLGGWSAAMVAWDRYIMLGSDMDAVAVVCYKPTNILDALVDVGKQIDGTLMTMLKEAKLEVDRFIEWYALQQF
jgi:hypothetical protein